MQWANMIFKEGSSSNVWKPNIEETNRKSLGEHDLQSRRNEIVTGNTESSNGMKTYVKTEKIPEFSPYFQSDCGMIRDNLEENGDEISRRKSKLKRKKGGLEKHKGQGDNEEKIDAELCCYGKIKSKRGRKSKKDIQVNIDHKSSCYGLDKGFGEDKLATGGKLKSKEKKKVAEIKMLENDEHGEAETSKLKHKKHEPQGDNGEKIDPELCCYGSAGMGDQTAIEKINSKKKRRSKKCVAQVEIKEKIDPKPCCEGYDIGFVEDMKVSNGKIKSIGKKAVEDELLETDHGTKTSKVKLKKTEPEAQKNTVQVGAKKIDAKPLDNGSKSEPFSFPISKDLMGDKVLEDGQEGCVFSVVLTSAAGSGFESISIKFKNTVESAMVTKACHCSRIDNVEKSVEVEALEDGRGLNENENETGKVELKNRKSNDKRTARNMNDK